MEKHEKREEKGRGQRGAGRGRVVRQPITAEERAELMKNKPKRGCWSCIFRVSDLMLWAQTLLSGFPVSGLCANHPDTPGQMRPVPGTPCRNFRAKPRPDGGETPVPPYPNTRYIPLTQNLFALVDAEDYERLKDYKWHVNRSGPRGTIYAGRRERNRLILMHRQIMNPPKGKVVDHINGNGLDNRRCNLRICDQRQNAHNNRGHADRKSRFLGVNPTGDKWFGKVGREYLGVFDDEVEAAKARDRKAQELYGEHAWLNFPPGSPEGER
jgi:hypothetical protein